MVKKTPFKRWCALQGGDRALWHVFDRFAMKRINVMREVYLFVPHDIFERMKVHFTPEPHRAGHWRTEGCGWHLHAVDEGTCVNIHVDTSNPTRGLYRMARHFVQDVVVTCVCSSMMFGKVCLRPYYKA